MTFTKLPDQIIWEAARNRPPNTVEQALLWGKSSEPGLYYYLVKWYPGYMSAPHWYETDRLCVVVSGTWWVASGEHRHAHCFSRGSTALRSKPLDFHEPGTTRCQASSGDQPTTLR
jgi:hypothetical protein